MKNTQLREYRGMIVGFAAVVVAIIAERNGVERFSPDSELSTQIPFYVTVVLSLLAVVLGIVTLGRARWTKSAPLKTETKLAAAGAVMAGTCAVAILGVVHFGTLILVLAGVCILGDFKYTPFDLFPDDDGHQGPHF